ncbi:MAG: alpha/beta fold hydrolase [Alkalispirochaeta sp.]
MVYTNDQRLWPVYHRRPPRMGGGDGVPVVLFHGFGNDGTTWIPLFEYFGLQREMAAPDLPGFGRHPLRQDEDPTPRWYTDRAAELLRELTIRWGQPPIVVGKSMGGMIAGLVAGELPALVRALVLIDPGGIETTEITPFWDRWRQGRNLLLPSDDSEWDEMIAVLYYQRVRIPGFLRREGLRQIRMHRERYRKIFERLLSEGYDPLGSRLSRITCPVTVIWGAHDEVMHPSGAERVRRALPAARIEILPECGHSPTRERPREVERILVELFSRWG